MPLCFLTFTFWNYYVLKLLRLETVTFSDATFSDINVVLCYILSQYRYDPPQKATWTAYVHFCDSYPINVSHLKFSLSAVILGIYLCGSVCCALQCVVTGAPREV